MATDIEDLSLVATEYYPHSAFTGLTKSLQHQWTHTQRVIPDIAPLFEPLEDAIAGTFVPALYGSAVGKHVRSLSALAVKSARLAITNPVETSQDNYTASTFLCLHVSQAIQGKIEYCSLTHTSIMRANRRLPR